MHERQETEHPCIPQQPSGMLRVSNFFLKLGLILN